MEEWEVVCNKCNGEGAFHGNTIQDKSTQCSKCLGTGIVDWIENIMGKTPINDIFSADPDGSVHLYYAGNKIYETTPTGDIKFFQEV